MMVSTPFVAGARLAEMSESGQQCVAAGRGGFHAAAELRRAPALINMARSPASEQRRVAVLAKALQADVIPRLVLARQALERPSLTVDDMSAPIGAEDAVALADIVMRGDFAGASAFVGALRARDVPLEQIYLDVFAPAARHLGELWSADRCDFTSVTIGLCCLQQLVLENSSGFRPRPGRREQGRRILLGPTPGEQHSFGLLMVGEFFRRQGWDVHSATGASAREIAATVRAQWFSVVGLSMAGDERIESLATLIREIRRTARNRHIGVLVGGQAFIDRPELTALVGADATASDGQQAVLKAETLMALLAPEE